MFCLVTDLMDYEEYPAPELAALYKWRWDGSETALREAKAPLRGAGPGTGPMLRSGSPDLVRQELAAWAAAVEMTRGVTRDAALAAAPAGKGRRAGLAVRPRDLSFARAVRAVLAAIRLGTRLLPGRDQRDRGTPEHRRPRPAPRPQVQVPTSFAHATAKDTVTRIAPAVITMANTPPDQRNTVSPPAEDPAGPWTRPPRRDTPPSGMPAGRELPAVIKNKNYPQPVKHLKPMALT